MTLDQNEVLRQVRQAFGTACQVESFRQFKGGARKQVFFLQLRNPDLQCMMYVWHNVENYFAERVAGGFEETQSDANAPILFLTNTRYLLDQAINVPQVLHSGTLASGHQYAFVEQIEGANFNTFAASATADERSAVLNQMNRQLTRLHRLTRPYPGPLVETEKKLHEAPQETTLKRALLEIEVTAQAQAEVTPHLQPIRDKLQSLWAQVTPRTTYHLLHGELAGNHVLVRAHDQAVYFVDIEGIHFADLEAEHTFLQMIYGTDYRYLTRSDLDPARMAFYKFAMHISLTYAGSCFMLRGFHDLAWAESLFKRNVREMLNSLKQNP
jgi:Phosphotransferase enzyme family